MLALSLALCCTGQTLPPPPVLGARYHDAPWIQARDVALIIEGTPIEDRDTQQTIKMLVELYEGDWLDLSNAYILKAHDARVDVSDDVRSDKAAWRRAVEAAKIASSRARELLTAWRAAPMDERVGQWADVERARTRAAELRAQIPTLTPPEHLSADATSTWRQEASSLTQMLRNDMLLMLEASQQDGFTATWNRLQRTRLLRRGTLSGESLDLDALWGGFDAPLDSGVHAAVEPILQAWRREIDVHLDRRTPHDLDEGLSIRNALTLFDETQAIQLLEDRLVCARAVRDCNLNAISQIARTLPEDARPAFEDLARERAFYTFMRPTQAGRMLARAVALDSIDQSQRVRIETIAEHHDREMQALRESMISAWMSVDGTEDLHVLRRRSENSSTADDAAWAAWHDALDEMIAEHERVDAALDRLLNQRQMREVRRGIPTPARSSSEKPTR